MFFCRVISGKNPLQIKVSSTSFRMLLPMLFGFFKVIDTNPISLATKTISLLPRAFNLYEMFSRCLSMVLGDRNSRIAISGPCSPSHMSRSTLASALVNGPLSMICALILVILGSPSYFLTSFPR